jgi:guanylate kinase
VAKGPLVIISGPSGTGKSTIVRRLLDAEGARLRLAVSATTRAPRAGEVPDQHYHFWSKDRFADEVRAGAFLEWADVFGARYGTPASEVFPYLARGTGVLLEIDVQGADQVRRQCPAAVSIFVRAPSLEDYEQRLRERRTESDEAIQLRLEGARRELERAGEYDYVVINDDLDRAVAEVQGILHGLFERDQHA